MRTAGEPPARPLGIGPRDPWPCLPEYQPTLAALWRCWSAGEPQPRGCQGAGEGRSIPRLSCDRTQSRAARSHATH
jgi:hypothetical protein